MCLAVQERKSTRVHAWDIAALITRGLISFCSRPGKLGVGVPAQLQQIVSLSSCENIDPIMTVSYYHKAPTPNGQTVQVERKSDHGVPADEDQQPQLGAEDLLLVV